MEEIFHGKRISLVVDQGKEIVLHPGAVVILPILDDEVILIQNRRQAVDAVLWELPAGTLEENEEPLACAKRELEEETGYRAKQLSPLFQGYSTPGFTNERLYFFLAQELSFFGQNLDDGEEIVAKKMPFEQALAMLFDGTICDLKTQAALLFFAHQKQIG